MPVRRSGAAIPLITLVVSFGLVLTLGAGLGRHNASSQASASTPASGSTQATVRIVVDGLSSDGTALEPIPGLRVSALPGKVTICMSLGEDWGVTVNGKVAKGNASGIGDNPDCRTVTRGSGKIGKIEIELVKNP